MSEFRVTCPRCGIALSRLGRRDIHFGPDLRHDKARVNQMATELYVCIECGHLELFHPKIGNTLRSENPPYEAGQGIVNAEPTNTGGDQNA